MRHAGGIAEGVKVKSDNDTIRKTQRLNSILDYMLGKRQIDGFQHAAGKQAWEQWSVAEFSSLGSVDMAAIRVDGAAGGDALQRRIDSARKFGAAMVAIGLTSARAFGAMVLHEQLPVDYGREHYRLRDVASARSAAYAVLIDALSGLDIHYTGGKRPNNAKTRTHMAQGGKPRHMPETHTDGKEAA